MRDGLSWRDHTRPPALSAAHMPVANHDHKREMNYDALNEHARNGRYGQPACTSSRPKAALSATASLVRGDTDTKALVVCS